ncbi:hypothetical protein SAY87_004822 [Trapa incisa]|uniref:EF-hand domain-containing protein n=1 Tax=Trapa incisa TaxID=236973 RepID=A0AAN7PTG8_9MYRT|nr:hypothetical protein SAY87_004822 [Trapa incisa]
MFSFKDIPMEHPSCCGTHPSFLQIPGCLMEVILGQSVQTWVTGLHKSVSRLWSSLRYRAEVGNSLNKSWAVERPIHRHLEQNTTCMLRKEDAEMVMSRLGIRCTGEWDGTEEISRLFEDKEPSLEEVREAFKVFDVNGDGFIDTEELHRVLRGLGLTEEELEEGDCGRMIGAFDENGDGRIDFREFVKLLEKCLC